MNQLPVHDENRMSWSALQVKLPARRADRLLATSNARRPGAVILAGEKVAARLTSPRTGSEPRQAGVPVRSPELGQVPRPEAGDREAAVCRSA
jgi:hypothetical protein